MENKTKININEVNNFLNSWTSGIIEMGKTFKEGGNTIKAAEKFIGQGDKVKFTIRFKGREFEHHDIAESLMDRIREKMEVVSKIEQEPKLEGRQFTMIFSGN